MTRLATYGLAACLLFAAPHAVGADEVEPSAVDVATARELFREGARLAKEEKWAEALDAYQRSMSLRPSNLTRYSIAVVQERMGRLVEAMESLRAFLESDHDRSTQAYVRPASDMVRDIEKRIGRLRIVIPGKPRGATVLIDGQPVPDAAIGVNRPTDPGSHHIEARVPGHPPFEKDIELKEGGDLEVVVQLGSPGTESATGAISPSDGEREDGDGPSTSMMLTVGGAGVFVAGLGLGVYGFSKAKSADSSEGSDADTARTFALVGDIGMGVGLVAAGVGTYLLLTEDKATPNRSPASAGVHVGPWAGRRSLGFGAAGVF